ncbi:hypothetical protein D8B26_003588 [Coccidioides posadasii str. Silveira]|uniref:Uncharacterized protein n=2 Tax=Coccidioides posadasii TaxID=199306 RepID=E9D0R6_COCPS|nr:conserved hypothetical protein [Coccidioides posadasii str. Silveira]QVM08916.1 hypothetical protein D8B26_003588 [Coccidioides posadasii str. Silveira]
MVTQPEPSHAPANPSLQPAPSNPHPDTITFTVNSRTLSMDEKAVNVPASALNPVSVRPVQRKINTSIGITIAQGAIFVSGIISAALLGSSITKEQNANIRGYYSGLAFVPIAPVCLSAFWALVALGISRGLRTPVHPAFYVAFDLLLWLTILGISICIVILLGSQDGYACSYNYRRYRPERGCRSVLIESWKMQMAANALAIFNGLAHFGIFVWGCRMVHKVNKMMKFEVTINLNGFNNGGVVAPAAPAVYA